MKLRSFNLVFHRLKAWVPIRRQKSRVTTVQTDIEFIRWYICPMPFATIEVLFECPVPDEQRGRNW
jgi:hypothetical protein